MGRILDSVRTFLVDEEWQFEQLEGQDVFRLGFSSDTGQWTCFAQAREDAEQFVFYSRAPVNVPEDRRSAMAEFLTRANYGMVIGNFEMDYDDGEVRYKTSIDIEGAVLIAELAKPVVYANVTMMTHYLEGILAVAFGGVDPLTAITAIEMPDDAPEN